MRWHRQANRKRESLAFLKLAAALGGRVWKDVVDHRHANALIFVDAEPKTIVVADELDDADVGARDLLQAFLCGGGVDT